VRDFLQQRAGWLVLGSWLIALYVCWTQIGQTKLLTFWIYCYPLSDLAKAWHFHAWAIGFAKVINLGGPVAATAFFPRHRFQAGRAAALAVLLSIVLWLGSAAWIASHSYPS